MNILHPITSTGCIIHQRVASSDMPASIERPLATGGVSGARYVSGLPSCFFMSSAVACPVATVRQAQGVGSRLTQWSEKI